MFKKIITFIESYQTDNSSTDDTQQKLNHAVIFILLEVACADNNITEQELSALKKHIINNQLIAENEVDDYLQKLIKDHDWLHSIQPHTRLINEQFDNQQKVDLLKQCWQTAYSDNELDKHEEHRIRKLSDLLHLSHKNFIQTKLQVTQPK